MRPKPQKNHSNRRTTHPRQLELQDRHLIRRQDAFGGSLLKGNNPKQSRPLDSKQPIHVVFRAKKGGMRTPKAFAQVSRILETSARKHGVKIYNLANVGNHLHLVVKLGHVRAWSGFVREVCGRIGLLMKKLGVTSKGEGFWLMRPFTRIVKGWGRAFRNLCEYVYLNELEARGIISRKETRTVRELRAIWGDP